MPIHCCAISCEKPTLLIGRGASNKLQGSLGSFTLRPSAFHHFAQENHPPHHRFDLPAFSENLILTGIGFDSSRTMAALDHDRRNKHPRLLTEAERDKLEEFVEAIHYSSR